jgi:hypothetical protein
MCYVFEILSEACVGLDGCSERLLYAIQISTRIYGTSGITCARLENKVCLGPVADIDVRNDWHTRTRIRGHPRSETFVALRMICGIRREPDLIVI